MEGITLNNLLRKGLLIVIAGLLAVLVAKMHFGQAAVKAIKSRLTGEPQAELTDAAQKTEIGPLSEESLGPTSEPLPIATSKSEDVTRILSDGSRLGRMLDGYGNSTITRTFRGNRLLRMVMVRYHRDGERKVFVYGKNGKVVTLDKTFADHVLSAPAKEIAANAKIVSSENVNHKRKQRLATIRNNQRREAEEKRRSERPVYVAPAESEVVERDDQPEDETNPEGEQQDES